MDVLVGMDIINRGDFVITADGKAGRWFSFRFPPKGRAIRFDMKKG